MTNKEKKHGSGIGWAVIAASIAILFTCGFLTALVGNDYAAHEKIALSLTLRHPIALFKEHPEPLWHLFTCVIVRLTNCNVKIAAGIVSGGFILLSYIIAYFAFRKTVPGLETHEIAALDLVLHLVAAIYVPMFNKQPYLGQGTPNVWHNPTTIAVRPIALLVFVLVTSMVIKARKEEFESNIPVGKAIVTSLLLILSCLAKPSFVQIFYPSIFTLMVLWLIMYRGKNLKTAIQLFLMCLPSLFVMILQFVIAFYGSNEHSGGIMFAPFYHGNFSWGFILGIYIIWLVAVRQYLKFYFSEQMTGNKRGFGFILATLLLALHLISGIYYLFYIVVLGHTL